MTAVSRLAMCPTSPVRMLNASRIIPCRLFADHVLAPTSTRPRSRA